jgi:hypothetical protein
MGPTGCSESSLINYHYSLRNDPEERNSRMAALCLQHWLVSHVFRNITIFILDYDNLVSFEFMVCRGGLPQTRAIVRKLKHKNQKVWLLQNCRLHTRS